MPLSKSRSRVRVGQTLTALAVAVLSLTGILAGPAAAAPAGVTMYVRNISASVTGPVNCPNIFYERVTSVHVPFGTAPPNPRSGTRSFTCTRGSTVVRVRLTTNGVYSNVNNNPTIGRGYRLHVYLTRNGGPEVFCSERSTVSSLAGRIIDHESGLWWSQFSHSTSLSTTCNGQRIQVGLTFSEGESAP